MTKIRLLSSLFLAVASAGFALWGCSSNLTSSPAPTPSIPTVGSTLTQITLMPGYPLDTTVLTVDSATIADPNVSGATVITLVESTLGQRDSTYQSIEPNGNVALNGEPWGEPGTFYVLPFASSATIHTPYNNAGVPSDLYAIHNGPGSSYTIDGATYTTDSATVLQVFSNDTIQYHYTYIPSLGIMCRKLTQPSASSGQDESSQWIIAYTPK